MSARMCLNSRIIALVTALTLLLTAAPAIGQTVTHTTGPELASAASGLDGRAVSIEGEVISELLDGGDDHKWVNILSEGTGIGIWAPGSELGDITVLGDWNETGDIVRVVGTFHQGCSQHGGDLDIHATSVTLLESGFTNQPPLHWWKLVAGLPAAGIAAVLFRRMRQRGREEFL